MLPKKLAADVNSRGAEGYGVPGMKHGLAGRHASFLPVARGHKSHAKQANYVDTHASFEPTPEENATLFIRISPLW